jgi:hypothetical protein
VVFWPGGRPWTRKEGVLLGTMPDGELAARIGRTAEAVRVMRTRLGIATTLDHGADAPTCPAIAVRPVAKPTCPTCVRQGAQAANFAGPLLDSVVLLC